VARRPIGDVSFDSAAAFRQSIEDRLRRAQVERGVDLVAVRRRIVFGRVLARLVHAEPGAWVLKGGVALQVRMPDRARTTRDLDLAVREDLADETKLRATIVEALSLDPDRDLFRMTLRGMEEMPPLEAGRIGWRLSIRAELDGREFATIRIDVVARSTERDRTDRLVVPSELAFAGIPDVELEAVNLDHHFAEKLAAYTTDYGDRDNTRVKDLADLVLFVEAGLEPTSELREVVDIVFAERGSIPPDALPVPPSSWTPTYAGTATAIGLEAATLPDATRVVDGFWRTTIERDS
jgi:predicted nucleotidyltransferase component of viral defense system